MDDNEKHLRDQLEAARGLLVNLVAALIQHETDAGGGQPECNLIQRARAFLTATQAPEVPDHIADTSKMAEQGERQEAVCMRSVGHWEKSFAAIWPEDEAEQEGPWVIGTIDEGGNKYPVVTIDADQYDAPGDSKLIAEKLQALWAAAFTTSQPGPGVRGLWRL
ncbi:hypothetical protein [Ectopseudomonas hydrolytica]|uniref:hypothetical protein n=1 Tax=Ectopseudomonas hydrolytica TaxID=2493633 RepID=UPI00376F0124